MTCPWPAKLKEAFLRRRARQYAKLLRPGCHIYEDVDGPVIEDFREYLPAALAELHMEAVRLADGSGFVIQRTGEWQDEPTLPSVQIKETYERPAPEPEVCVAVCQVCGLSWMGGQCEHGVGKGIVVQWGSA